MESDGAKGREGERAKEWDKETRGAELGRRLQFKKKARKRVFFLHTNTPFRAAQRRLRFIRKKIAA